MTEEPKRLPLDTLIYDAKLKRDRYICNPEKNTACNKRGCFWSGGLPDFSPCFCTSYFQYAVGSYDEMNKLLREYYQKVNDINKKRGELFNPDAQQQSADWLNQAVRMKTFKNDAGGRE